jgi:TIR domain
MSKPTVFISYSHHDEIWKDEVVEQLNVLEFALVPWDDRQIGASQDWQTELERAMERAVVAVLLVTASFLVSKYVKEEEIPRLRARRERGLLSIFPIIVMPCSWRRLWLGTIQVRPKDGRALLLRDDGTAASKPEIARDLADIVEEIADLVQNGPAVAETSLSGVTAAEKVTAPLGASPELAAVAQSAIQTDAAVRQVTDSATDTGTERLLAEFENAFRDAGETIALITGYKELHDELHTFELDTFAGILNEYNRVEADEQARQRLILYAGELQATAYQVRAIAKDLPARPGGIGWIEKFERAHALLFEAIRDRKQNPATTALTLLNGVLDSQPGLLNEQIVVHTGALDFEPVQTALKAVRQRLATRQALPAARLAELAVQIEAMSRLEGDFRTIVQKHDAWQQVEHGLRTIETTIAASFAQLEFLWPILRRDATPLFSGIPEQWALDLDQACSGLDAVIAAHDPQRAAESRKRFRQFRRLCSKHFFEIDEELRAACRQLSRVGESLQLLLRMLDSFEL